MPTHYCSTPHMAGAKGLPGVEAARVSALWEVLSPMLFFGENRPQTIGFVTPAAVIVRNKRAGFCIGFASRDTVCVADSCSG